MNLLTYTSGDAPEGHRWLARFQVGKGFTTAFATAPTREAVIAKAQAFWDSETARLAPAAKKPAAAKGVCSADTPAAIDTEIEDLLA